MYLNCGTKLVLCDPTELEMSEGLVCHSLDFKLSCYGLGAKQCLHRFLHIRKANQSHPKLSMPERMILPFLVCSPRPKRLCLLVWECMCMFTFPHSSCISFRHCNHCHLGRVSIKTLELAFPKTRTTKHTNVSIFVLSSPFRQC